MFSPPVKLYFEHSLYLYRGYVPALMGFRTAEPLYKHPPQKPIRLVSDPMDYGIPLGWEHVYFIAWIIDPATGELFRPLLSVEFL